MSWTSGTGLYRCDLVYPTQSNLIYNLSNIYLQLSNLQQEDILINYELSNINISLSNLYQNDSNINISLSNLYQNDNNINISLSNLQYNIVDLNTGISNINISLSNLYQNDSNINISLSNLQYNVVDLNTGISNLQYNIGDINISLSNLYQNDSNINISLSNLVVTTANAIANDSNINISLSNLQYNVADLNIGISNNTANINYLSGLTSNYATLGTAQTLSNKTMDYNSNIFLNFPTGTTTGGSNITSILNISNPWKFKASSTTPNQTILANTWTTVECSVEEFDPANSYNPSTYTYTMVKEGYYYIDYSVVFLDTSVINNETYQARIWVNGTTQATRVSMTSVKTNQELMVAKANLDYYYVGDTIQLQAWSSIGSTLRSYNGTHFNAHLLSITTPLEQQKLYTIVNSSNQITGNIPYWDGYSNQLNSNGYNYVGDIQNLNTGISNLQYNISDLNIGLSNQIAKEANDVLNLNIGYSNNSNLISQTNISLSNQILKEVNDILNLNIGYSNNANNIAYLSGLTSNYATLGTLQTLSNKTMDYTKNTFLNFPSGGGGGTSNYYYLNDNPVGSIVDYTGTVAPSNWLLCYGQAISRTTYSELFAVIGTTYGVGDNSTTFNVPDYRGRVSAGKDDMGGSSANRLTGQSGGVDGDIMAGTGGEETHTLTVSEIPSHTHDLKIGSTTTGTDTGFVFSSINTDTTMTYAPGYNNPTYLGATGSGGAHNNVQPTIICTKIIKYTSSTTSVNILNTNQATNIQNIYNPYWGRAFMNTGYSNLVDGVWTDMPINEIAYGNSMSSFNTSNNTFTCLVTGLYRWSLGAQFINGLVGESVGMRLYKNNISAELTEERAIIRNGTTVDLTVSDILVLNAGDTIKYQTRGIGSSTIDVVGSSYSTGGEDKTHISWQLETATNVLGGSNLYAQLNSNIIQVASNIPLFKGSNFEFIDSGISLTNYAVSNLKSATTSINISSATAPSVGQALVATSASNATWQTISSSSVWSSSTSNIYTLDSNVGIGTSSAIYPLDIGSLTSAIRLPVGTTAQRPTGNNGIIRYNTSSNIYEGYTSSNNIWLSLGLYTNYYCAKVQMTSAMTGLGAGNTLVNFDKVIFDTGNNVNTSASSFVCPIKGIYRIDFQCLMTGVQATKQNGAFIRTNGSNYQINTYMGTVSTYNQSLGISGILSLNANDYIQIVIYSGQTAGTLGIDNDQGNTYVCYQLISTY